jgi:hypothetical protein
MQTAAQHARAADAAPRRARSCLFQRQFLLQRDSHLLAAAPLTRHAFGRPVNANIAKELYSFINLRHSNSSTSGVQFIVVM